MKQWWRTHSSSVMALVALYALTTLPFVTRYAYNWDAAQFELSLEQFSIHMHQPHPPGYLLFVGLAKAFSLVMSNHWAVVLESVLFGLIAVIMFYVLTTELWPDRRWLRWTATVGFLLNPLFWLYRETSLTYTVDAAAGITLAWLCLSTLRYRRHRYFIASSIILPLVCGFRPSLLVLLGPLWLLSAWHHKRNWRFVLLWAGVALGIALLWFIPLLVLSGGLSAYWVDSGKLYGNVSGQTSLLAGAPLINIWQQIKLLLGTLLYSWNGVALVLVGNATLGLLRWQKLGWKNGWLVHHKMILWATAWTLPAMLLYGLIHLGQLGYVLLLLPIGYVGLGSALVWLEQRTKLWPGVIVFILGAHALIFLWVKPGYGHPEYRPATTSQHWLQTAARLAPNLFKLNRTVLAEHDATMAAYETMLATADPATTVIVTVRDVMYPAAANNLPVRNPELFRELSLLAPEFLVIELAPQRDYFLSANAFTMTTTYDSSVVVPDTIRTVLIPAHMLPDSAQPSDLIIERQALPNVTSRYYRGIMDKPWRFLGYTIQRPADL